MTTFDNSISGNMELLKECLLNKMPVNQGDAAGESLFFVFPSWVTLIQIAMACTIALILYVATMFNIQTLLHFNQPDFRQHSSPLGGARRSPGHHWSSLGCPPGVRYLHRQICLKNYKSLRGTLLRRKGRFQLSGLFLFFFFRCNWTPPTSWVRLRSKLLQWAERSNSMRKCKA